MSSSWDLIIVGSGPAGMGAAVEASRQGLKTLVLDRQTEPGGQIYRNVGSSPLTETLGKDYAAGLPLVKEFQASTARYEADANVWHVLPGQVYYSRNGESSCARGRQILLTTGTMERPVPMPGWTLPGVMGAGAADVLLKSASLMPEGPVVLCGNGPLIFQAAAHLLHYKIPVAGVLLTGRPANMFRCLRHAAGAVARPLYFTHGIAMAAQTFLRQKCHWGVRDISLAEDRNSGLMVSYVNLLGKRKTLEASVVLLHEGVISESRITRLARLRHDWDSRQRYWHASADLWGRTSLPGIRIAGDVAKVLGATAAQAQGRIAALDICRELGRLSLAGRDSLSLGHRRRLARCRMLQPFLDEYFAPDPGMLQPRDDALVCRCEELTALNLKQHILQGSYSPDGLKAQSRSGMGTCQGRMCGSSVIEMIAHAHGLPLEDLPLYTAQPPLFPLRLGELADMGLPPDLL